MCYCKEIIEEKFKARFIEQQPDAKEHEAKLTEYALIFGETTDKGAMGVELKAKFLLKKGGEKEKTIRYSIIFTFCPFCGVKYESA